MQFSAEEFKRNLEKRLHDRYGKNIAQATKYDLFDAVAASVLDPIRYGSFIIFPQSF